MALLRINDTFDSFEVMEDFHEIVDKLNKAADKGTMFTFLNTMDGKKIGFAIPNVSFFLDE